MASKLENSKEKLDFINSKLPEYEDLAPINNVENCAEYIRAIHWGINNSNVKNIALSGPYSSGKSSILRTYEKENPSDKYLKISLASFQQTSNNIAKSEKSNINDNETKKNEDNKPQTNDNTLDEDHKKLIELSILQQMLYKVDNKILPDSRFNRINALNKEQISRNFKTVIISLIGLTLLFHSEFWDSLISLLVKLIGLFYKTKPVEIKNQTPIHYEWLKYLGIFFIIPAIKILSNNLLRILNNYQFNKVNLIKGEVELGSKSETSILNKHLDEILYFFEATQYSVVFIEDLDRFNDPEIFVKLREINLLINNAEYIKTKGKVTFIYAIKDDMFQNEERTKFFDFIIPVIPVINTSNSFELMSKKIYKEGSDLKISKDFLSTITLYINDMRLLKNIFNEFTLYHSIIKSADAKVSIDEQLFAIIVYKNKYPNDFAKLHINEGIIFNVFENFEEIKKGKIKQLNENLKIKKEEFQTIKNHIDLTLGELRAPYLVELINGKPDAYGLFINNDAKPIYQIRDSDADFNFLINAKVIYYSKPNNFSSYNTNRSFTEVEKIINPKLTYLEREKILKENNEATLDNLSKEINNIELELLEINDYNLSDFLIQSPNMLSHFKNDFKNEPLLVFFVKNGYINEIYSYFISYFYPGSISLNDKEFKLSVANRNILPMDFKLTNIKELVKLFKPSEFKEQAILNFQLVEFITKNEANYQSQLENLLTQFTNNNPRFIRFYDAYIESNNFDERFLKLVINKHYELWETLLRDETIQEERLIKHLKYIGKVSNKNELVNLDSHKSLSTFILRLKNFTAHFKINDEHLIAIKLINCLNIKFKSLEINEVNPELFDFIYEKDHYELNYDLITLMLKQKSEIELEEHIIARAKLTAVKASSSLPIIKYIDENLRNVMYTLMESNSSNTEEAEDTLIWLLNKPKSQIANDLKIDFFKLQSNNIKYISNVNDKELWPRLFETNKLEISWLNVLTYFEEVNNLDKTLVDYLGLETVYIKLSKTKYDEKCGKSEEIREQFSDIILTNNELKDNAYLELLNSNPYYYEEQLNISGLSKIKLSGLIEKGKIRLDVDMYNLINDVHPSECVKLIEYNILEYFVNINDYHLDPKELNYLLNSSILKNENKRLLIDNIKIESLESEKELLKTLSKFLITQSYQKLKWLPFIEIFKATNTKDRLILFEKYLQDYTHEQIYQLIDLLDMPYKRINILRIQPKIPLNEINKSIVNKLEGKEYIRPITKYSDNEIKIYNRML